VGLTRRSDDFIGRNCRCIVGQGDHHTPIPIVASIVSARSRQRAWRPEGHCDGGWIVRRDDPTNARERLTTGADWSRYRSRCSLCRGVRDSPGSAACRCLLRLGRSYRHDAACAGDTGRQAQPPYRRVQRSLAHRQRTTGLPAPTGTRTGRRTPPLPCAMSERCRGSSV
jgi:hypothetical protein